MKKLRIEKNSDDIEKLLQAFMQTDTLLSSTFNPLDFYKGIPLSGFRDSTINLLKSLYPDELANINALPQQEREILLEDILEREVIRLSEVSDDLVKSELKNLRIYRDKDLAHAEDHEESVANIPRPEVLARLSYGFYAFLSHLSSKNIPIGKGHNVFTQGTPSFDYLLDKYEREIKKDVRNYYNTISRSLP